METVQYLRALGRSWFIVLIALVAGGAGGYYVYHHATPMYRSSVRMAVAGSGDETTARVLATQRAQSIAQVANTPPAINAAAAAAGYPGATPGVTAVSATDSPFITLSVQDTNPRRAQAIANKFATVLPGVLTQVLGRTDTPVRVNNLADANLPSAPYSPDRNKDVGLGLAAGLVLGIFIALLREVFNRTVRDSDELERLTGLTVLGTVPRDLPKRLLPAVTDPRSARAEAYRQIRTTLLNAQSRDLQTVAVTSAALGEGKTSVATNVAAVFSRAGHRVALVDADLRRPRVAAFFGLKPQYGLTEVLSGVATLPQALTALDDGRLAVLTSGRIPANPSEALGSVGMERVIEQLTEHYEYVIIDTPPVLPVTDASVLAPKVDGVIVVARIEHTTRDRVKRAISSLRRVNANVLGVVPNQAGKGTDRDYRYPYRYAAARRSRDRDDSVAELGTRLPAQSGVQDSWAQDDATDAQPSAQPARYAPPPQVQYSAPPPEPAHYAPPPEPPAYPAPVPSAATATPTAPAVPAAAPAAPAAPAYAPPQYPAHAAPVQYPADPAVPPAPPVPPESAPPYPGSPTPVRYAPPPAPAQQPPPVYRAPRQQPLNGAGHEDVSDAAETGRWRRPAHGYDDE